MTFIICIVLRLRGGSYPQYILDKAAELNDDNERDENKFFPLYDKILNYWFPPTEDYDVCPQWSIPGHKNWVDYSITYAVEHRRCPLLLVEVKPPSDLRSDTKRSIASNQVIVRLHEVNPVRPNVQDTNKLYSISAIGKRWRAWYVSVDDGVQPVQGIAGVTSLKVHKSDCWNPDITSDDSWVALRGIVDKIKDQVTSAQSW